MQISLNIILQATGSHWEKLRKTMTLPDTDRDKGIGWF